jgi:hypothetical protein
MTRSGTSFSSFSYDNSTGAISIAAAQVTGPFVITGAATLKVYTVTNSVTNTTPGTPASATHGTAYSVTLVPGTGYDLPASITMTRSGSSFTNFTYSNTTGEISIAGAQVTGSFVITGAATRKIYAVTNSVSNTTPTSPSNATHGIAYGLTLIPDYGYDLPVSITMTRSGANFTNFTYNNTTGAISIAAAQVTGPFVITGAATLKIYSVTAPTNTTINNTTATHGTAYSGTITGSTGYIRPASVTVTVGGSTLAAAN